MEYSDKLNTLIEEIQPQIDEFNEHKKGPIRECAATPITADELAEFNELANAELSWALKSPKSEKKSVRKRERNTISNRKGLRPLFFLP